MKSLRLLHAFLVVLTLGLGVTAKEFTAEKPASLEGLRFANPARQTQLFHFRQHAREKAAKWSHMPVSIRGQHILEYWIDDPGSEDTQRGNLPTEAGVGSYEWNILYYRMPNVFGLSLQARSKPKNGWAADLWYRIEGSPYFKDLNRLTFRKFELGKMVQELEIGEGILPLPQGYAYSGEKAITAPGASFSALASSDQAFLQEGQAVLNRLEDRLTVALKSNSIQRAVSAKRSFDRARGPYDYLPIRAEDAKILSDHGKKILSQRRQLLLEHHKEFRKIFLDLVPAKIWKY